MPRVILPLLSILSLVPMGSVALAQYQGQEPTKVSVSDLVRTSSLYNERPVITVGEIAWGDSTDSANNIFELRGDDAL